MTATPASTVDEGTPMTNSSDKRIALRARLVDSRCIPDIEFPVQAHVGLAHRARAPSGNGKRLLSYTSRETHAFVVSNIIYGCVVIDILLCACMCVTSRDFRVRPLTACSLAHAVDETHFLGGLEAFNRF